MKLRSLFLFGCLLAFSGPPTKVILSGIAQDCFEGASVPVRDVNVTVFDYSHADKLVTQLRAMDKATFADGDTAAMTRFEAQYSELMTLVNRTHQMAQGTSGADGKFSYTVKAVDSVLVVGYEDLEDAPYYYSYASVPARSNASFVLDMSRGTCSN